MQPHHLIVLIDDLSITELKQHLNTAKQHDIKILLFTDNDKQCQDFKIKFENEPIQVFKHDGLLNIRNTIIDDLGLFPEQNILISDIPEAIEYFRKSGFGYLIGCGKDHHKLSKHLADDCIESLKELSFDKISDWFEKELDVVKWCLTYRYFDKNEEKLRETMTTVGNGFVGRRGSLSFMKANDDTHYPGTYIAGLFNKVGTKIADKTIYNNDFVNIPNAFLVRFKFENDKDFWSLDNLTIKDYQHRLYMKTGETRREILLEHPDGRQVKYSCYQFSSMQNMHALGHKIKIQPVNFDGSLEIQSSIDGDIINYGVERYRKLNGKHLNINNTSSEDNHLKLQAETTTSKVKIDLDVFHKASSKVSPSNHKTSKTTALHYHKNLKQKEVFELERSVFIQTSRNQLGSKSQLAAFDYQDCLDKSAEAWQKIWKEMDIKITGDRYSQQLSRLQMYHLVSSASPNNEHLDAATTARGLHGEAYRGHIFWDEIFILPFYFKNFPKVSKSLLMYRYRRLDAARAHAQKNNKKGALIPWQIADTGEEETQEIHYNPMSGQWDPDLSRKQRHVSISVAFNLINYHRHTLDEEFLANEGGEMLLEIVRYWASKVRLNQKDNRYHIYRIMGPDEFHEKYPENPDTDGGIDDNAYTNLMVSWLFKQAIAFLPKISSKTKEKINFKDDEKENWLDIANRIYVSIKDDIIEQFKGYFKLKEIDFEAYEEKYGDIGRMDRILKSENDSPDHYKVAKQADTLMLFYLLEPEEVKSLIEDLGYKVGDAVALLQKNFDYYIKRTSHGSTLSYCVHAYLLDHVPGREDKLWKWFQMALSSDFDDIQGGTTEEGIHCGVMSGNINLIYKGFAGVKMGEPIHLNPSLPKQWKTLETNLKFQQHNYKFKLTKTEIVISTDKPHQRTLVYKNKSFSFKDKPEIIIKY